MKHLVLILAIGVFMTATDPAAAQPGSAQPSISYALQKVDAQDESKKPYVTPPEQIGAIRHGAYHEFIGFSVNSGLATWIGFDLDRAEAIKVQRYAPPRAHWLPKERPAGSEVFKHETPDGDMFDLVTRKPLEGAQLDRMIEPANRLWGAPPPIPWPATDVYNTIVLFDGSAWKGVGGFGLLPAGAAQTLGDELKNVFQTESQK